MKCTAALTLALAALAMAAAPNPNKTTQPRSPASAATGAPSTGGSQPGAAGNAKAVTDAIDAWLADIKAVNAFVDTAGKLTSDQEITAAAATAFAAAKDEGVQNDALARLVQLDASGRAASTDLANQFAIIGPAISDTITSPKKLQQNLDAINGARCPPPVGKGAIFEEGAVQQSAARAAGITAALPEIPAVCGTLAQAYTEHDGKTANKTGRAGKAGKASKVSKASAKMPTN